MRHSRLDLHHQIRILLLKLLDLLLRALLALVGERAALAELCGEAREFVEKVGDLLGRELGRLAPGEAAQGGGGGGL